jgi:hypothetical protein
VNVYDELIYDYFPISNASEPTVGGRTAASQVAGSEGSLRMTAGASGHHAAEGVTI